MEWMQIVKFLIQGLIFGGAGLYVTFKYSEKQQQLAEDKFNHDLLIRFNNWYDELNDDLHQIEYLESNNEIVTFKSLRENKPELFASLNDYINLCAEEKLWHSKGRIDKRIWKSWKAGMNYWYKNLSTLQDHWANELKSENANSYYLEDGDELFLLDDN